MFRYFFIALLMLSFSTGTAQHSEHLWAGANQYQLWYQPQERITNQLDAMQDAGLSVLRIFLGVRPEYSQWEDPPEAYSFEPQLGEYNDDLLEKVDYLMAECKKRGILLIVALENANYNNPYEDTFGILGQYTSENAIQAYKNRFSYFLNHRNNLLGRQWKDLDNVILAWEISNEPGIKLDQITSLTTPEKTEVLRTWLTELSDHLKSIDPNTFVSLGIAGYDKYYQKGIGDDILALGNIKSADIYTLHFYGGDLARWFRDVQSTLRSWRKLLIMEEFGVRRRAGDAEAISTYRYVTDVCYEYGIPWMFWRLGHRKDGGTWSIMEDDPVWQQVVEPRARKINRKLTPDEWTVYEKAAAAKKVWEPFEQKEPYNWSCWEKTSPFYDDASACYLSNDVVTQGNSALACEFSPDHSTKAKATFFTTRMSPYDWDLIESFQLDIYNATSEDIAFEAVITSGSDRIETVLISEQGSMLSPGWNKDLTFSLENVVDKGWINQLLFRVTNYTSSGTIHIDNLRLEDTLSTNTNTWPFKYGDPAHLKTFRLLPAYPNPFTKSTQVRAILSDSSQKLSVSIFNVLGQKVTSLAPVSQTAHGLSFTWNGRHQTGERVPAGVYFIRAEANGQVQMSKISLVRP